MLSLYLPFIKSTLNAAKKIVLVLAVFFIIINLFLYFIQKDKIKLQTADPIKKNREEIYKVINDPKLNETKQGKLSLAVYKIAICGMIGEACTNNPDDGDKNFNKSLAGFITGLIVLPYLNPPASGLYWVHSGLQESGFIPKSLAAEGIGFSVVKPLTNIWKLFRDLSYMLLVLVLVIIGFLIMFRMKINPQTVISIESALPRIVVSLLLITFSFPIAGFLIDIMYVLIAIVISVLSKNTILHINASEYQNNILSGDGFFLFDQVFWNGDYWGVGPALFGIFPSIVSISLRLIIAGFTYLLILKIPVVDKIVSGEILKDVVEIGGVGEWALKSLIGVVLIPILALFTPLLLSLFVFLTALFIFFRIAFMLFRAYLEVLVLIILSPIFLLFEALPGKSVFSYWFKNLFANLLVFPLITAFMLLSNIIVAIPSSYGNFWRPPFLNSISANSFSVLIGVGIMFLIPDFVKLIKELMGVKGLPLSIGPGTFLAGTATALGGGMGLVGSYSSIMLAFPGLRRGIASKLPQAIGNIIDPEAYRKSQGEILETGAGAPGAQGATSPTQHVPPSKSG